jgi:hypothetical protein
VNKRIVAGASALILAGSVANAAVVTFNGAPSTSFADGTFSSNLSGLRPDGFYGTGTSAFNGYGQKGLSISFTGPVTLGSLSLGACSFCQNTNPAHFTVNLYGVGSVLLDSQSISGSSTDELLTFDQDGVSKVEFTFDGTDGSNPYGDGREVAWYTVHDITYSLGGVPEPAVWALMIGGFGMTGVALRRRKARAA